jgi:hypothetical protein
MKKIISMHALVASVVLAVSLLSYHGFRWFSDNEGSTGRSATDLQYEHVVSDAYGADCGSGPVLLLTTSFTMYRNKGEVVASVD